MPKSWIGWAVLLVVVVVVVRNPAGAGHWVRHAWDSASTFITSATG